MKFCKYTNVLLITLSLATGLAFANTKASAHGFMYWTHPHWVTVKKATTIVKIKNTYPLCNSYAVKKYRVYPGHHLKVHHMASYDWVVESGKYNTGTHYTYAANRGSGTGWFRQGIH